MSCCRLLAAAWLGLAAAVACRAALPVPVRGDIHVHDPSTIVRDGAVYAIFSSGNDTNRYAYLSPAAGDTGRPRFAITATGPGNEQRIDGPNRLVPGSWIHLAATLDGERGLLFVQGNPVATNASLRVLPWQVVATNNWVGRSQWPDPYFLGRIDSLRVYGRTLTADEVKALAQAAPADPYPLVPAGAEWRYLDGGRVPPPDWRLPEFDDHAWASGPAPLGYGDADGNAPRTTNSFGTDPRTTR
jgi:hypothetical protein